MIVYLYLLNYFLMIILYDSIYVAVRVPVRFIPTNVFPLYERFNSLFYEVPIRFKDVDHLATILHKFMMFQLFTRFHDTHQLRINNELSFLQNLFHLLGLLSTDLFLLQLPNIIHQSTNRFGAILGLGSILNFFCLFWNSI